MALAMARPWKHPKTGIYWLRKRIPDDLRARLGKREEKLTLKTRDPAEAKRLHAAAVAALEQRWSNMRAPVRKLDQADFHRVTVTTCEQCVKIGGPPGIIWDTESGDNLWEDALDMGVAVQRNWCHQRAGEYAAVFGLRVDDDDLLKIAKAIGVGAQKAALTLKRQAKGDFSPEGWLAASPQAASSVSSVKPVAFQVLLEGWAAEKQPTQKTISSWTHVLEQFGSFIGHNEATRVTPEDLLRWKAALLDAGLRTKTIRDSKIAPIRAVLQWGVDNRTILTNPAARVVIDIRGKMSERIRGFTDEEAALILRQAAGEPGPVRRWLPLLCAYSGARISEVCQLRGEDIIQQAGIWCMKFDPAAGTLKKINSERAVPLHPAIIASGFLEFVASHRPGPLFPSLNVDRFGNRGASGTRMISRWVRGLGITDMRISPSHSWRHRFKTLGRRCDLMPDIVNAITGHHRKTIADAYGEFPVEALFRELSKIPPVGK
jgi:integrase